MTEELNKSMYFGATPAIFERASKLRRNMTSSEELLWNELKGKQILGLRFRRQHPVSKYIVDFYCHAAKLVIELDGKIHLARKESDRERTKEINDLGLCIIRFRNEEVEKDIDNVVVKITKKVQDILNSGE